MTFRTRFAPSPSGPLHLGHAYSALLAYDMALENIGGFLLRMEDIDQSRARTEWEDQIYDDLKWLGLLWPEPVVHQSERLPAYADALDRLDQLGLTYACTCNRKDIAAALSAPQEGTTPIGPDGPIYPGTCRDACHDKTRSDVALRLNMRKAVDHLHEHRLFFRETGRGAVQKVWATPRFAIDHIGDIVLSRRDMGTSYHLSVVVDDAAQDITHVIRGADLANATHIHVILQQLLGLPTPVYHHHKLIRDDAGKRLAKRDDARAIRKYRDDGLSPQDIRDLVGL